MDPEVTSTELVRNLSDVLARVRYRQESFAVLKNGRPVARVVPYETAASATLADLVDFWASEPVDVALADALEAVGRAGTAADNPWDS